MSMSKQDVRDTHHWVPLSIRIISTSKPRCFLPTAPVMSKWPFDPSVGGHQQPLKGSRELTIPKRSPKNRQAVVIFMFCFPCHRYPPRPIAVRSQWTSYYLLGQWLNGLNFLGWRIFSRENKPSKLLFQCPLAKRVQNRMDLRQVVYPLVN